MKKILILVIVIVGLGIVSRTLIQNQGEKTSEAVRIPDEHLDARKNTNEQSQTQSISSSATLQEKIRVLEEQIGQYENILKSEDAIDRINHNEVSEKQRQHYFDIIRELTSMRIQKNNLKIQELEQEG